MLTCTLPPHNIPVREYYGLVWPSDFTYTTLPSSISINTMAELNPQQLAAIKYIDGPLLVIAGAGSGKTRVITQKIAYLLKECELHPKHIYALTFTNKAAKEMSERVSRALKGQKASAIQVSTFHSLGLHFLKKEGHHLGLKSSFTLFDSIDSFSLLKELSQNISATSDESLKHVQQMLSNWKNNLVTPQEALETAQDEPSHLAARFYAAYEPTLLSYNAVDFDDLIIHPTKILRDNPETLSRWQNTMRYLLVDEYQDTNSAQYHLIKQLVGVRGALTVVGDDDQSIYAWRGAKPENISLLQQDFPLLKVIKLEQNYRSTRTILRAANHLISHNPHTFEKKLWSALNEGDPIRVIANTDETKEIECVVHEILAHQFRFRHPYSHYAILYRSNHQARYLEQALREQGIPYHISGGVSFFSRTEVKDLLAYFRLTVNPDDDGAFLRCVNTPKRDIGPATLEKLSAYAKTRQCSMFNACFEMGLSQTLSQAAMTRLHDFSQMMVALQSAVDSDDAVESIEEFVKQIGYEDYLLETSVSPKNAEKRLENVKSLIGWLKRLLTSPDNPHNFGEAIHKMLLCDMLDRQSAEQETNVVQLMTLHAAKGLEFPHVFILGLEEECLPHKNSIALDTIEEERRLAYVGITRAKQNLVLTYTKQRKRYGEIESLTPSRFLDELPAECLQFEGIDAPPIDEEQNQLSGQAHLKALKAMLSSEE